MDDIADTLRAASARNLYRKRRERGLTLDQLTDRSGIARSTLVKWEAGNGNPTLSTVAAVASALGLTVQELLAEEQPDPQVKVVRAQTGTHLGRISDIAWFISASQVPRSVVEFYEFWVDPSDDAKTDISASHGSGSVEHVYVVSGQLELGPLDHTVVLSAGDFASYPTEGLHGWRGIGTEKALVFVTLTVPLSETPHSPMLDRPQ